MMLTAEARRRGENKGSTSLLFLFVLILTLFSAPGVLAAAPAPDVRAAAWLLVDHGSGQVLAEHRADARVAPASLVKLMTAYLLFQKLQAGTLKLDDWVRIGPGAWAAKGARIFLQPGTRALAENLLKGMIVASANDAALALAEHVAGSEEKFVAEMNATARALGMDNTVFVNVTGLDQAGQRSSARDLGRLARALIRDFPDRYKLFALKEFTYAQSALYNRNALLWRDAAADGVKTGQTRAAGFCLVASAQRGQMRLIAVVLGAKNEAARTEAGERLMDYGFRNFETRLLYGAGAPAATRRVWMGDSGELPLGLERDLYLTLPRGGHERLRARLTAPDTLHAPVGRGQRIGTLALELDRQPYAEYPLVALKEIKTGNILRRALDHIRLWLQ